MLKTTSKQCFLDGREQTAANKFTQAEASLSKALELRQTENKADALAGKELAETWYLLGYIYNETLKYTKAMEFLKKAVNLDPELTNAWISLAFCYYRQNNTKKAAEAMGRASELEPDNAFVLTNLAGIYLKTNELDKAESVLEKGIKKYPNNGNISYNFACLCARLENKNDCLKFLEMAIENGTPFLKDINEEKDFNIFKADKDFQKLLKRILQRIII